MEPMTVEKFREELFRKLWEAHPRPVDKIFSISKALFSGYIPDVTIYMDSEMQHLVTLYPYRVAYISSLSTAEELKFLDITPDIEEQENGKIKITNYFYDSFKGGIGSLVTVFDPSKQVM